MTFGILVVDDSRPICNVVRGMLRDLGVLDVDIATTFQQALDALDSRDYALVIVDFFRGDENKTGADLLAAIQDRADDLPAVIMTAMPNKEMQHLGRAGDFLTKPFSRDQLRARLEALCGASRLCPKSCDDCCIPSHARLSRALQH